jgi:hypothetical protein
MSRFPLDATALRCSYATTDTARVVRVVQYQVFCVHMTASAASFISWRCLQVAECRLTVNLYYEVDLYYIYIHSSCCRGCSAMRRCLGPPQAALHSRAHQVTRPSEWPPHTPRQPQASPSDSQAPPSRSPANQLIKRVCNQRHSPHAASHRTVVTS